MSDELLRPFGHKLQGRPTPPDELIAAAAGIILHYERQAAERKGGNDSTIQAAHAFLKSQFARHTEK